MAKAAKAYVDRMVVRCGDSSFVREGKSIWELEGGIEPGGCHEPPTIAKDDTGRTSWSCGIEVYAPKMRASLVSGGWTEWGDPPPLLVGVIASQDHDRWKASVSPERFAVVTCNDVSGKDVRREGKSGAVTVNTPGDGFLALRSQPSSKSGVRVLKIPHGSELHLGACIAASGGDNWCEATYQGQSGWILDRYVVVSMTAPSQTSSSGVVRGRGSGSTNITPAGKEAEMRAAAVEQEKTRIAALRNTAEKRYKTAWSAALASEEPWSNLSDLLAFNKAAVIAALSKGHKVRMKYSSDRVEFSEGTVAFAEYHPLTDIYKGIPEGGFSWEKWFDMTSSPSSKAYTAVCILKPDDLAGLLEGGSYVFMAKLKNLSSSEYSSLRKIIMDCARVD